MMNIRKNSLLFFVACLAALAMNAQTIQVGKVSESDELSSIPNEGYRGVCTSVSAEVIQKYAGSEVVGIRVALGSTAVSNVYAFLSTDPWPDTPGQDLAAVTLSAVTDGWNEATFPTSYTLTGTEKELYIGYYFTCEDTEARPVLVGPSKSTYGLLVHESGDHGPNWYDYSSTGDLAVQLVLRGGGIPEYDIALDELVVPTCFYPVGTTSLPLVLTMSNKGSNDVSGLTLSLEVDGDFKGDVPIGESISGKVSAPFELPINDFNLSAGAHSITLRVKDFSEGIQIKDGTTDDDVVTCTFYLYEQAMTRNCSLLEVFASSDDDYYESRFTTPVEEFLAANPTVVPVFIHGNYNEAVKDPLAIRGAEELFVAAGATTAPSWGMDRAAILGKKKYIYDYSQQVAADEFTELLQLVNGFIPAFATVELEGSYAEKNRVLTLTAKGTRGEDFKRIFGEGVLTIYLTEDGVEGHNHVLRKVLTTTMGDKISWNEANGMAFSKDYRSYIDPKWEMAKMHAVAFISKAYAGASKRNDMMVANTAVFNVATLTDGIDDVNTQAPESSNVFYDLSGRRVNGITRPGLYIRGGKHPSKLSINNL